jgi:splicing factor 4
MIYDDSSGGTSVHGPRVQALSGGEPWDASEYQENKLRQDNVGFQLLQRMGWSEGAGLGADRQGVTVPVGK